MAFLPILRGQIFFPDGQKSVFKVTFPFSTPAGTFPEVAFSFPTLVGMFPKVTFPFSTPAGTFPEVAFSFPTLVGVFPKVTFPFSTPGDGEIPFPQ
jgi:hypothetical protein